jgi:hypothetical protein
VQPGGDRASPAAASSFIVLAGPHALTGSKQASGMSAPHARLGRLLRRVSVCVCMVARTSLSKACILRKLRRAPGEGPRFCKCVFLYHFAAVLTRCYDMSWGLGDGSSWFLLAACPAAPTSLPLCVREYRYPVTLVLLACGWCAQRPCTLPGARCLGGASGGASYLYFAAPRPRPVVSALAFARRCLGCACEWGALHRDLNVSISTAPCPCGSKGAGLHTVAYVRAVHAALL